MIRALRGARHHRRCAAALCVAGGLAGAGCGSSKSGSATSLSSGTPDGGGAPAVGACDSVVEAHPPTAWDHLPPCDPTGYDTNPPSGGSHYSVWAAFQNYDFAVPPGFLVHSLEHGAVIYWYDCPEGCAGDVDQAEAFIAGLPSDPLCAGNGSDRRVILVPSPDLPARWAASSWGFTLTADCFDPSAMRSFYDAHYGQGREDLCAAGLAVTPATCPQ